MQNINRHTEEDGIQTSDLANIERLHQDNNEKLVTKPAGFGVRHIQVLLLFMGMFSAYALRANLSIGIVAMVDSSFNADFEEFKWNESTRGILLSSFFWGYVVAQVPAGLLAQMYGAKILLLVTLSVCALFTLLTPIAAGWGWQYLCAVRIIQGLAQGSLFPSTHTLLARWVPLSERGFLAAFTYSGSQLGTVIMLAASGVIAASTTGWPGIFYISGGFTAVWCILWSLLGCDFPSQSNRISQAEKEYIVSTGGVSTCGEKKETPWKAIFKSKAFWALLITHSAQNWFFWTLLTEIPSYMNHVLEYDIKSNAFLSALPYLMMWILTAVFSNISDMLMNRKYLSVGAGRKLFNSIGHWVPAATLVALGYVSKDQTTWAVVLLTISVSINSATLVGFMINHLDLSPNFAGTLMSLTNCASNIMSLMGPLFVGFVVTDSTDASLWRIVFFVTAGMIFFGNIIFIAFGSGEIQSWNSANKEGKETTANSTNTLDSIISEEATKT